MKSLQEIPIGSLVYEKVEKYEATVVRAQVHLNGCHRVILQERRLKDGVPVEMESVDIQSIEIRQRKEDGAIADSGLDVIGLLARDKSTGYTGTICVVETRASGERWFWLQSSERTASGDRVKAHWLDEEFAELLEPRREATPEPKEAGRGNMNCSISR